MVSDLTYLRLFSCLNFLGHYNHGHIGAAPHGLGHIGHGGGHTGHDASQTAGSHPIASGGAGRANTGLFGLIPSPRVIFSLMTLFGASGYALVEVGHCTPGLAGLLAVLPALLIERFAVTPLWNLLFRFQGKPSVPLQALVLSEATAVTPFHNGRGLASVVHDGRIVQFRAELTAPQKAMSVRVGDTLFIEEVDAAQERITVSLR